MITSVSESEDGTVHVLQYDWAEHFQPYFKRGAFDGITSFHHLIFSSGTPGKVGCEDAM